MPARNLHISQLGPFVLYTRKHHQFMCRKRLLHTRKNQAQVRPHAAHLKGSDHMEQRRPYDAGGILHSSETRHVFRDDHAVTCLMISEAGYRIFAIVAYLSVAKR